MASIFSLLMTLGSPSILVSVVSCVVTEMDLVEPPRSIDVEDVCGRKREVTFQLHRIF